MYIILELYDHKTAVDNKITCLIINKMRVTNLRHINLNIDNKVMTGASSSSSNMWKTLLTKLNNQILASSRAN